MSISSEKLSPFYSVLKKEVRVIQNIESILDKVESEGNISLLTSTFEMILNKEMVYAVQELKKLRIKQPKLDLKTQLTNNTLIFKENLKLITNYLIDAIWNEKVNSEKIQQTIDWATQLIYKGNFEEIQEEDEEHLYNSWLYQKTDVEKGPQDSQCAQIEKPQKEEFFTQYIGEPNSVSD